MVQEARRSSLPLILGALLVIFMLLAGCTGVIFVFGVAWFGASTNQAFSRAQIETTYIRFEQLDQSLQLYQLKNRVLPDRLDALVEGDPPILDSRSSLEDGWNNPIRYTRQGGGFTLSSDGADGMNGTEDDLAFSSP
ncbi:MAG: type II secretion system protein GspG [Myxococcota bacterium]